MAKREVVRIVARVIRVQRGSVPVFFFACLLPLIFFLLSLSLDVGAFLHDRASTQKVLDDAAMYAYRFLPDRTLATNAQQQFLQRYGSVKDGASVAFNLDGMQLQVSRQFPLIFATMFGLGNVTLPIQVASRVRAVPFDVFITLDATSAVAPPQLGAPWAGGEASTYFNSARFNPQSNPPDKLTLTQQCFNSVFSGLKNGAIQTLDYLGGFSLNSVGVGVDNGNIFDPLELIRTTRISLPLPQAVESNRDASFISFTNNFVSTLDCAAVAEAGSLYQLPTFPSGYPSRGDFSYRPSSVVQQNPLSLNPAYLPYLQAREVLWSQVARGSSGGSSSTLLLNAFSQMLQAPPVQERRGLIGSARRVMIFFAADLPRESGQVFDYYAPGNLPRLKLSAALTSSIFPFARAAVDSNASGRVEIIYALLQPLNAPNRQAGADDLQRFFDDQSSTALKTGKHFSARVIYSVSPQELLQGVLTAISAANQTAVISQ